jgi:hypothetical protein
MPFGYPASFKEQSHPGDHPPIIDRPLWDAVQARLAGNTAERDSGKHTRQPSLLAGMLFVGDGKPMTPSHTVKKGVRYRYYFSRPLITKDQTGTSTALRIPAAEIEQLVAARVRQWLLDPAHFYTGIPLPDLSARRRLVARAGEIGKSWPKLAATRNTPACFACRPDRADRRRGQPDRYPFAPGTVCRAPRRLTVLSGCSIQRSGEAPARTALSAGP